MTAKEYAESLRAEARRTARDQFVKILREHNEKMRKEKEKNGK